MSGGRPAARAVLCLAALLSLADLSSTDASAPPHGGAWTIYVGRPRPVNGVRLVSGRPSGCLDFDVRPPETRVFVDGRFVGTAGEYDGWPDKLYLPPGEHRLRLNGPDGRAWRGEVTVLPFHSISVRVRFD